MEKVENPLLSLSIAVKVLPSFLKMDGFQRLVPVSC